LALADYFDRAALAASQVLEGFDPLAFEERVAGASVGIAVGPDAVRSAEGRNLLDMLVRLLARLYPRLEVVCPAGDAVRTELCALAKAINPRIDLGDSGSAEIGVVVGEHAPSTFRTSVHVGAIGWDSFVSSSGAQPLADTGNPLGAGTAACIAAANVFRYVFLSGDSADLDASLVFSTHSFENRESGAAVQELRWSEDGDVVLGGVGAIGMATAWAVARLRLGGVLHLVDPERIELSNLQRYVLATRRDVGRQKVRVAALRAGFNRRSVKVHQVDWRAFVSRHGYRLPIALAAFDSAETRRELQSSLPRWVANAWTQPGDLGVSVHPRLDGPGACLACLYLPEGRVPNDDELIANALGVPGRVTEIRTLLHLGRPAPPNLLTEIAGSLGVEVEKALAFGDTPIRDLYVRGVCGGALVPLGASDRPHRAVHVPLAHQSALAGILLAARLARRAASREPHETSVARVNVLRKWPTVVQQPALKRGDGRCLCEDDDYKSAYRLKYDSQPDS